MEVRGASTLANLINSTAELFIGLRAGKEGIAPGPEIESCTADENWYQPATFNVDDPGCRFPRPLTRGVVYFRGNVVDQVMRDAFPFFDRNLSRRYLNAPIDLNRVAVNDLAAQLQRQFNAQRAFTRGSWTNDRDNGIERFVGTHARENNMR